MAECILYSLRSQAISSICSRRTATRCSWWSLHRILGSAGESADEHEESRLVAHDRDVSLAGCSVLQPEHVAGTKLPRLAVSHGNGKAALQDDAELNRGSRMIEPVFQVLGAPTRVESSEESACGGKVVADINRRRRGREVRLAKLGGHV